MNKLLILPILGLILITNIFAQDLVLFKTCSNPLLIEGELQLFISKDRTLAKVSLSGLEDYPTSIISIGGPILTLDYKIGEITERIVITVDGKNEIYTQNKRSNKFEKIGNLNCY